VDGFVCGVARETKRLSAANETVVVGVLELDINPEPTASIYKTCQTNAENTFHTSQTSILQDIQQCDVGRDINNVCTVNGIRIAQTPQRRGWCSSVFKNTSSAATRAAECKTSLADLCLYS